MRSIRRPHCPPALQNPPPLLRQHPLHPLATVILRHSDPSLQDAAPAASRRLALAPWEQPWRQCHIWNASVPHLHKALPPCAFAQCTQARSNSCQLNTTRPHTCTQLQHLHFPCVTRSFLFSCFGQRPLTLTTPTRKPQTLSKTTKESSSTLKGACQNSQVLTVLVRCGVLHH